MFVLLTAYRAASAHPMSDPRFLAHLALVGRGDRRPQSLQGLLKFRGYAAHRSIHWRQRLSMVQNGHLLA